jgi:hypothetical protein
MLSGLLVMPLSQLCFALIAGWALGLHQRASTDETSMSEEALTHPSAGPHHTRGAATAFALLLGGWLLLVLPEAFRIEARQQAYTEAVAPRVLPSRFWQQGVVGWERWPSVQGASDAPAAP